MILQTSRECIFRHDFGLHYDAYISIYHDMTFKSSPLCQIFRSLSSSQELKRSLIKNKSFLKRLHRSHLYEITLKLVKIEKKLLKNARNNFRSNQKLDTNIPKLLKRKKLTRKIKVLRKKRSETYTNVLERARKRCRARMYLGAGRSSGIEGVRSTSGVPRRAKFLV